MPHANKITSKVIYINLTPLTHAIDTMHIQILTRVCASYIRRSTT